MTKRTQLTSCAPKAKTRPENLLVSRKKKAQTLIPDAHPYTITHIPDRRFAPSVCRCAAAGGGCEWEGEGATPPPHPRLCPCTRLACPRDALSPTTGSCNLSRPRLTSLRFTTLGSASGPQPPANPCDLLGGAYRRSGARSASSTEQLGSQPSCSLQLRTALRAWRGACYWQHGAWL